MSEDKEVQPKDSVPAAWQWRETISIEDTINFLNELLRIDSKAVKSLIDLRVECNEQLAKHPTVQVRITPPYLKDRYDVGLLGILNGLFGINEAYFGPIVVVINDDTGELVEFRRTTAKDWSNDK